MNRMAIIMSWVFMMTQAVVTRGGQAPVCSIAFHPNQPYAVWNGDGSIIIHDLDEKIPSKTLQVGMTRIRALAFHPEGKWLAAAGGDPGEKGSLMILNWPDGELLLHQDLGKEWLTGTCVSPDGERIAVSSGEATIHVYRVATQKPGLVQETVLSGHAGSVMDVVFGPDGHWLVSAGSDRSVKIWDLAERKLHRTFSDHTGIVFSLDLRPTSGKQNAMPFHIASASSDKSVRIWQPTIGRMVRIIRQQDTELFTIAYHPSGNWMASGGKDGTIRCMDARSDRILSRIVTPQDWIYSLAFSPDGTKLASGDWSGKVIFHRVQPSF
jgi:WD40 repeat protein